MSWTVPQGCYYGCLYGPSWDVNQVHYYGAGSSVPDSEALESNSFGMLIDFRNNYIYTLWLGSTITINPNNTFTLSNNRISSTTRVRIIGSEKGLEDMRLTIVGNFSFGDGTGLLSKSALKLSNTGYSAYNAFRGRDDITIARFADGLDDAINTYNGCPLESVEQIPNTVTALDSAFANTPLIEAPAIPSSVVSMSSCFSNCSSLTSPPDLSNATALTSMYCCFKGCTSLATAPSIPSTVTDMYCCFYGCSQLATSPEIPASVSDMRGCFVGCTALQGNTVVYNNPSYYGDAFTGTTNDIYIINGAGTSAVGTTWKTIASGYSNVHYEADDNQIPSLSFTATRVGGMASETPSENGEYAFINATAIVYETYLPDGWSCAYDAGEEDITKDGTTQSPYWTRTNTDNVWTLKCWLALGDTTKHTFTLQVADEITDENDNVKASQLSALITQIIPKAYKLVDYYHDPNTDTEGMSIGKFATDANLFDVDMPTLFRDTTTCQDMTTGSGGELEDFLSELDVSGAGLETTQADWVVEQGITGDWTWRKWQSGIAECWGMFLHNTTVSKAWGNGFLSYVKVIDFPTGLFVSPPSGMSSYVDSTWAGLSACENQIATKDWMRCFIFRTSSTGTTAADFYIHVDAKGRWK